MYPSILSFITNLIRWNCLKKRWPAVKPRNNELLAHPVSYMMPLAILSRTRHLFMYGACLINLTLTDNSLI
jgi:hypothetical protein